MEVSQDLIPTGKFRQPKNYPYLRSKRLKFQHAISSFVKNSCNSTSHLIQCAQVKNGKKNIFPIRKFVFHFRLCTPKERALKRSDIMT